MGLKEQINALEEAQAAITRNIKEGAHTKARVALFAKEYERNERRIQELVLRGKKS